MKKRTALISKVYYLTTLIVITLMVIYISRLRIRARKAGCRDAA